MKDFRVATNKRMESPILKINDVCIMIIKVATRCRNRKMVNNMTSNYVERRRFYAGRMTTRYAPGGNRTTTRPRTAPAISACAFAMT